jgi:hypothetical protein
LTFKVSENESRGTQSSTKKSRFSLRSDFGPQQQIKELRVDEDTLSPSLDVD